jgi:MFS family permease
MSAIAVAAEPSGTKSLWRDRRFAAFWTSYTVSQVGDRVTELALPLIAVVVLDATPSQVGLLTAAVWLPNLIAMFVGTWIDRRTHKRRVLVVADLFRAAALLAVPVAYSLDALTLGVLFAVALATGMGEVVFHMAYPAFYVRLVPRESYVDANSKLSASRAAAFVGGPAVAGALIHAVTAPVAIIVDAISFLFSAGVIARLRGLAAEATITSPKAEGHSLVRQALEGMRFVVRHSVLRASLGCTTTINFFTFIAQALLILYASRTLGLSAAVIGLALGIGAAGGLVGAVIAPRIARVIGVGRTIMVGAVLFPAPIAIAAAANGTHLTNAIVLSAAELLSSIGVMLFDINQNAVITFVTPDDMRGRTAGAFSTINYGSRPIGAIVGGLLGTAIGLRPTLLIAAVGGTLAVCWLLRSPIPHMATVGPDPADPDNSPEAEPLAAVDGRD